MRIAVTGAHSSGKTTLARAIGQTYNIPFVRGDKAVEICRSLYGGQPINELSVQQQWVLQERMFESFDEAFQGKDCVTDGFHLTCLPYGSRFTDGRIKFMPEYGDFVARVKERSASFDKILYLPPEIGLENDGFRPESDALRLQIDADLRGLLADYDVEAVMGTVEQRLSQVGAAIGRFSSPLKNYVVLEGLPRAGKTTQLRALKERAAKEGVKFHACVRNMSPFMREFKLYRDRDPFCASSELIDLNVRSIMYDIEKNEVVSRAAQGEVVVADRQRFTVMSMFGALGVPLANLYAKMYGMPHAGKTIYLDVEKATSVQRSVATQQKSPLKHSITFQEETRRIYEELGILHNFIRIDANRPLDEVTEAIWQEVRP